MLAGQAATAAEPTGNHDDAEYAAFLERVDARFRANVQDGGRPVFTTYAPDLWRTYLDAFTDPAERRHHDCRACRQFVERFGSLVTIDADGRTAPAVWHEDDADGCYRPAVAALARAVRRARVTGVLVSSDRTWGTPRTGVWRHLSVTPPAGMVHRSLTQTAFQRAAERREDHGTVCRALAEFSPATLEQALVLLRSDALYRSEKVVGHAEWLHALHGARASRRGKARDNVTWLAVATAPAGFCHPRTSMIGTLLEDVAAGMDFAQVSSRFAAKMHPLLYQRPQAPPSDGTIAQAEKIVAQLGAAGSLARRFCRVEEVEALWRPAPRQGETSGGGVFGHLRGSARPAAPAIQVPRQTMTWVKFEATVLKGADRIEILTPWRGNYTALLTAVHPDAPPILQWDREDARNPVSLYVWHGGSPAAQWGLSGGAYHAVAAVALSPPMWGGGGSAHHGRGVVFLVEGARESRTGGGLALFPETLRSELHGVRSVIEAYSRGREPEGFGQPHAAGLAFGTANRAWDCDLRVWSGGRSAEYRLDRWD